MSLCERSVAAPFLFGGWSSAPPIIPIDEVISTDDSSFPSTSSLAPINRMRHRDYALFRSHTQLGSSLISRNCSRGFSTSVKTIAYDRKILYPHSVAPLLHPLQYKVPLLYRVPEDIPLVGQTLSTSDSVDLLTEEAMVCCQSLIQEIDVMERHGITPYYPLTVDDMLVNGLGRLEIKDGILVVPLDNDAHGKFRAQTWSSASHTLKKILSHSVGERELRLAEDFKDLRDRMESSASEKGYPLVYHISMLPLRRRTMAYLELFEYISLVPNHIQNRIMWNLPHLDKWPVMVKENRLMQNWFDYQQYDTTKPYHFFTYGRHTRAYGMSYRHYLAYTFEDIERIWQFWCPLKISSMHFELWKAKRRLIALGPHRLFPYTCSMPLTDNIVPDKNHMF
uniref:Uncharacterized protein n=1 Tax=Oryza meridionalis TaxID=40149 RepID=A0A0E0CWC2_9ORYZ